MFLELNSLYDIKKSDGSLPSSCITINTNSEVTTGKKLKSIIHKINNTFSSCDLVICDTLNRFNLIMDNSNLTDTTAREIAYREGSTWIEENQAIISELIIKHNIICWDFWLNHSDFQSKLSLIVSQYQANPDYKDAIINTAKAYLYKMSLGIEKNIGLCIEYLHEQCAVMLLWADMAYDFEISTSKRNLAMEKTHELLIAPTFKESRLLPVKVDVKYSRKKAQKIVLMALNQLIKLTHGHVYVKDDEGCYLYCNEAQAKSLGLKVEDVIGKTDYDLSQKKLADKFRQADKQVMQSAKVSIVEEEAFYNNKSSIMSSTKAPLLGENGEVIGVLGISVDITAKKEAELLKATIAKREEIKNRLLKDFVEQMTNLINKFQVLNDRGESEISNPDFDIKLTKRETEILYFLSRGKKPKEIASRLEISPKTVQNIIDGKLFPKLHTHNIGDLIEKCYINNLIPFTLDEETSA